MPPAVTDVLRRMDSAARARDLIAICGRAALQRAVADGTVLRVDHGRYALPECADPWLSAVRVRGVVSHLSAAALIGIDTLRAPVRPDVTVRRGRHQVKARGVNLHWADLAASEVDPRGRVTSPVRTVLDCARTLPFAEALAVADAALRKRLTTKADLSADALSLRGGGRGRVLRVVEAADGRAASVLESANRAILIEGGVSGFVPQLVIRDESMHVRVDLGDVRRRVAIESDSFEHHGSRNALVRDCRRYDDLVARGWTVLRFAWEHVMFEADWVLETVRAVIRPTRGHMSGSRLA